ncbi:MAG: hypothetical protein ABI565_07685 [Vicinamibacteria bacterium]
MTQARFITVLFVALSLAPSRSEAWPSDLSQRIAKDALKLLPLSLAELFAANQAEIFADARTSKMESLPLVYEDVPKGRLSPPTLVALAQEFAERASALHGPDFRAAVIALGSTYRLAVDLPDPSLGLGMGADGRAKAIRREFYLFTTSNLDKIPVVLVEPDSMRLKLDELPAFLARVAAKTPEQAARLREEGIEDGRVVAAADIDFRSPIFAVSSTAYSRSVSAVAATWIAIWRAAGGDVRRVKPPKLITPRPFGLKEN